MLDRDQLIQQIDYYQGLYSNLTPRFMDQRERLERARGKIEDEALGADFILRAFERGTRQVTETERVQAEHSIRFCRTLYGIINPEGSLDDYLAEARALDDRLTDRRFEELERRPLNG